MGILKNFIINNYGKCTLLDNHIIKYDKDENKLTGEYFIR